MTYRGRPMAGYERAILTATHEAHNWTARDRQIVTTYNLGTSLREIADHLGMSAGTIHWIVKRHPSYNATRAAAGKERLQPKTLRYPHPLTRRRRRMRS